MTFLYLPYSPILVKPSRPFCKRCSACFRHSRFQLSPRACAEAKSTPSDDDNDYFPRLKAAYENKNIKMFAKGEYNFDDGPLPWERPLRGRTPEEHRAKSATREQPEGFAGKPLHWTDLFTEQELKDDEDISKYASLVNRRVYLEKVTKKNDLKDYGGVWLGDVETGFDVEESSRLLEELGAMRTPEDRPDTEEYLQQLLYEIAEEEARRESSPIGYAEQIDIPEPELYEKWKQESEKRGGPVVKGMSEMLSPARKMPEEVLRGREQKSVKPEIPLQNSCLKLHNSEWEGDCSIFEVDKNGLLKLKTEKESKRIGITLEESYNYDVLHPETHKVTRTVESCEEALSPGKAVWDDGSFARFGGEPLLSDRDTTDTLRREELKFIGELCIVDEEFSLKLMRYHATLYGRTEFGKKGKRRRTATICLTCEHQQAVGDSASTQQGGVQDQKGPSLDILSGKWKGEGLSLHPFNYIHSAEITQSEYSLEPITTPPPRPSDLTYHLTQAPSLDEETRIEARRAYMQHKASNRVKTARRHDQKRIASCTHVEHEGFGKAEERNAVKVNFNEDESFLDVRTLRLGDFIQEKMCMINKRDVALRFPPVFDGERSETVQLIVSCGKNERKRLVVCLAADWTMTGAALFNERRVMEEASNSSPQHGSQ